MTDTGETRTPAAEERLLRDAFWRARDAWRKRGCPDSGRAEVEAARERWRQSPEEQLNRQLKEQAAEAWLTQWRAVGDWESAGCPESGRAEVEALRERWWQARVDWAAGPRRPPDERYTPERAAGMVGWEARPFLGGRYLVTDYDPDWPRPIHDLDEAGVYALVRRIWEEKEAIEDYRSSLPVMAPKEGWERNRRGDWSTRRPLPSEVARRLVGTSGHDKGEVGRDGHDTETVPGL